MIYYVIDEGMAMSNNLIQEKIILLTALKKYTKINISNLIELYNLYEYLRKKLKHHESAMIIGLATNSDIENTSQCILSSTISNETGIY